MADELEILLEAPAPVQIFVSLVVLKRRDPFDEAGHFDVP
jgi:hypothetical protein